MNTWRPFANGLVSHTFEDFQKKYDKLYSTQKPIIPIKEKFDPQNLYPFKIAPEDVEIRFQSYKVLKQRVEEQRDTIKKRDLSFEAKKKDNELKRKLELDGLKEKRERMMTDVRRNNESKVYRNLTVHTQRSIYDGTFEMTQIYSEKNTKMPPLGKKNISKLSY